MLKRNSLKNFINFLSSTKLFTILAFCLIVLLLVGTIAQKNLGLYLAHHKYFASFVVMLGGIIPFPGGYLIMSLISIGLTIKLLQDKWVLRKLGTIITHIGVITLLVGSGLTSLFSYEGNMVIAEHSASNIINDYFHNEIVISDITNETKQILFKDELSNYKAGDLINDTSIPFQITLTEIYNNTLLTQRTTAPETAIGFAKIFKLSEKKSEANYEENLASLSYIISAKNSPEQFYSIIENMPIKQTVSFDNKEYFIQIRKIQTQLPFTILLDKFIKETYPGTDKAKSYASYVTLIDDSINFQAEISMNKPLRYKGYSLFQSSFINDNGEIYSIFSVVKNAGRLFPYISTIIIALGILIHIIQSIIRKNA